MERKREQFWLRAMNCEPGYKFAIDDFPGDLSPSTVRDAIAERYQELKAQCDALNALLMSDKPEKAERLMIDNPDFRVWELVLVEPNSDFSFNVEKITEQVLKNNKQ